MRHPGDAAEIAGRNEVPVTGPHEDDRWLLDEIEPQGARYGITDLPVVTMRS